jgi:hypothetical protein
MRIHIKWLKSARTDEWTNIEGLRELGNNPLFGFYWWSWLPYFQKQYHGFGVFLFCYRCEVHIENNTKQKRAGKK